MRSVKIARDTAANPAPATLFVLETRCVVTVYVTIRIIISVVTPREPITAISACLAESAVMGLVVPLRRSVVMMKCVVMLPAATTGVVKVVKTATA